MTSDLAALRKATTGVLDVCEDAAAISEALRVLAGAIGAPTAKAPHNINSTTGERPVYPRSWPNRANNFQPSVKMNDTAYAALQEAVATYGKSKTARLIGVTRSIVAAASKRGSASISSVETIEAWAATHRPEPKTLELVDAVKTASEKHFGVVDEVLISQKSGASHGSVVALLSGFAIGAADVEALRSWAAT